MSAAANTPSKAHSTPSISVALGGGGARGFAHIVVIEALDELGVRPARIAGTSIGAVAGAPWAAGMRGKDIRAYLMGRLRDRTGILAALMRARAGRISDIFSGQFANPVMLDPEKVLKSFWPEGIPDRFEDLDIPLDVVATDYFGREQRIFHSGALLPAAAASMAIPGLFKPVTIEGRVMIDGGAVNPLPYTHLIDPQGPGPGDFVIACDVTGGPVEGRRPMPLPLEALLGAAQIMQWSITAQMLQTTTPDLILRPDVDHYRILDFFRAAKILASSEPLKDQIKRALEPVLTA
ncbi:MAG: patatin-like phospholipase family protein [Hyphomicrobiales bacterium]|nr:patatin-like phospholipase family protein [Hyphomicrobiales bacterium]